jgi:hypothetical protein
MKALKCKVVAKKLSQPAGAIKKLKDAVLKADEWELDVKAAFAMEGMDEDEELMVYGD